MGNVVRLGDAISCGDHCGQGSPNVFIGGMPVVTTSTNRTTGHGCWPPTTLVSGWSSSVFANGEAIALKGKTRILPHRCGKNVHDGVTISAASTVSIEE